jgi:hypothetical protein
MLTIPLETLAYIVTKAREFDAEVPPVDEDSGSNPSDDADREFAMPSDCCWSLQVIASDVSLREVTFSWPSPHRKTAV